MADATMPLRDASFAMARRAFGEIGQIGAQILARFAGPLGKPRCKFHETGRRRDQPGLPLDLVGIKVVFRAGHAPAQFG